VPFENDAARERARKRLLNAAKRYGIVPVGFMASQIRSERGAGTRDFSSFPAGSVTFLLTDIEGSTPLAGRLGDGYAGLLRDVRSIIRDAVRRCSGRTVDAPGDEYLSVFERPHPALEAAMHIQRSMRERPWPDGIDLRVRAGLHSGRPTLTDGGYVGLAVNTVARVCWVGHGGQIVISSQTKAAVERSMPAGVRFRSLGRHRLSGLTDPVKLYQVHARGLATDFPPLRKT
jgi:class 3 adenylate cyclase